MDGGFSLDSAFLIHSSSFFQPENLLEQWQRYSSKVVQISAEDDPSLEVEQPSQRKLSSPSSILPFPFLILILNFPRRHFVEPSHEEREVVTNEREHVQLPFFDEPENSEAEWQLVDEESVVTDIFNGIKNFTSMRELETPPQLTVQLHQYQKQGLFWLVNQEHGSHRGGILADDMGLGKTVQCIALMAHNKSNNPNKKSTLIVGPLAVLPQVPAFSFHSNFFCFFFLF